MSEEMTKKINALREAAENLKKANEELFAQQIRQLEQEAVNIECEAAEAAKKAKEAAEDVVEDVADEIKEADKTLVQRYGNGGAHAIEIILLATIIYFVVR